MGIYTRIFSIALLIGLGVPGAAAERKPPPPPPPSPATLAPAEATLRTYTWDQAFPVNPPFAEWTPVGDLPATDNITGGKMWLHRSSLSWRSENTLSADVLAYVDGGSGGQSRYLRAKLSILCDFHFGLQFDAVANAIIDPNGNIVAASVPRELRGVSYPISNGTFARLCNDASLRHQFGANR
jgi:hypothetical protein